MSQPEETPVVETPGQEVDTSAPAQTGTSTLSHEDALAELKKVRAEAAERRVKNKTLEEQAKKWEEYEESQKTELQKLQDSVVERDKRIADREMEILRRDIATEFNVAKEDLDLLVGDEENMKRLAQRLGKKEDAPKGGSANLLAGNRGTPVGNSGNTFSMDDFIRGTVR